MPTEPTYRAGTPQARHVHALLLSGQRALSELFPGFEQKLARAGAVPLRAGLEAVYYGKRIRVATWARYRLM